MKRPNINVADPAKLNLTDAEWKQLKFTGCVVKGDRIIRTLNFMNRVKREARKEIRQIATQLFK